MATFMNRYEVEDAQRWFVHHDTPNLQKAVRVLARLVEWTDSKSDGWPYWQVPQRAAAKLIDLIQDGRARQRSYDNEDITDAQLKKALTPIKSMLTRRDATDGDRARILDA